MEENKSSEAAMEAQGDNSDKIAKNYEATMNKLVAVVRGKENLSPGKRVKKEAMGLIVDELLKEDKERIQTEVKSGLKELLSKHVQLNKEIAEKEKEFTKLKQQKQKEFIEAASKLFSRIDDIGELEKAYASSLASTKG